MKNFFNRHAVSSCCITLCALILSSCGQKADVTLESTASPDTESIVSSDTDSSDSEVFPVFLAEDEDPSDTDIRIGTISDTRSDKSLDTSSEKSVSSPTDTYYDWKKELEEYERAEKKRLEEISKPDVIRKTASENLLEGEHRTLILGEGYTKTGLSDFSGNLFRQTFMTTLSENGGRPQNMVLSPFSVGAALALTANGASGDTKAELESALGENTAFLNSYLNEYISRSREEEIYHIANSVFLFKDNGSELVPSFSDTARQTYFSEIFHESIGQTAVDHINAWVNDNTKGMIPSLLSSPEDLSNDAALTILNTVAFEGKWSSPYTESEISQKDFHSANGTVTTIDFMTQSESLIITDEKAVGFLKTYKTGSTDRHFCFGALMPDEGVPIEDYVSTLSGSDITDIVYNSAAYMYPSEVSIPKFTFDGQYNLNGSLQALGINKAFGSGGADFSNLASANTPICISDVTQKAFIEVDETGTRAAAVTGITLQTASLPPQLMGKIVFDRPFLFFIYDIDYDIPIFIGTVCDL